MTQLTVYADATALIGLARIDRLDLVTLLPGPAYVTAHVWEEVAGVPTKPGVAALQRAREAGLLIVVEEGDPHAFPQVDAGESTVLTAAAARGAMAIIDERKARRLLRTDPDLRAAVRQAIGVVGLILLAKRQRRIDEVRPLLDALIQQDFWLSPAFYREILHKAGEL